MNVFGPPIEVTTRYATSVSDLPAAWAFVMERIDKVGNAPSVTINPRWVFNAGVVDLLDGASEDGHQEFEVVVSGMVHESKVTR